jgi:gamma-glutamyl-gamma-aminobutyrate hydrolase PuuD
MILLLDNSISKNDELSYINLIIKTLKKYKINYIKVNKIQNIDNIIDKIKGIIISGSSMKLSKQSKKENLYKCSFNFYYINKLQVPIYGICFGCQLLNILYDGELIDNTNYLCNIYNFYNYNSKFPLLKDIKTTNFSYCFSDIVIPNKKINTIFSSTIINGKIIETGFEFEKNRVFGTLFHPECQENTDIVYFNFYELCKKYLK